MVYSHTRSHEPENQARRYWDEESTPLFPFGHGLSYGRFEYADLTVDQPAVDHGRDGHRVGRGHQHRRIGQADEVVQLYLHQRSRLGVAAGARAQGLPAGHASPPGSRARSSSRSGRTSGATGTPRSGTG